MKSRRQTSKHIRPNILGDLRAEEDVTMLGSAFLETPDYRTLIETSDRSIIVGRRGTGKSALAVKLEQYWRRSDDAEVIKIAPEEYQTIGLRPRVGQFGDRFNLIRAGSRLAWKYSLIMETALRLSSKYKFKKTDFYSEISDRVNEWKDFGWTISDRIRELLKRKLEKHSDVENKIGNFALALDIENVTKALAQACERADVTVILIIDRLDEGYEPDDKGIGLIDGLVQSTIDLKTKIPSIKPLVFLRDNIFRSVQVYDPDYSRNIEGHILRLHWDPDTLFSFAAKRLKLAFKLQTDVTRRIWNSCTAGELREKRGFERCLHLTLYRPRDLLSLLNEAFYMAARRNESTLILNYVENAGQTISKNRLEDLKKEYATIIPGLEKYIEIFEGCNPEMEAQLLLDAIAHLMSKGSEDSAVQQDFMILETSDVVRLLYSIGLVGIRDMTTSTYVFCHDGRSPDKNIAPTDRILIHPCYWMALNCSRNALDPDEAEEIFDEYDIEISSITPGIRNARIEELIRQLSAIDEGAEYASDFEKWCHTAVRICFAAGLRNVEFKPNKNARMRRDIVATNLGEGDAWRRIYDDYSTRQVIFEVKNYKDITSADYQQMISYLSGEYGKLGFVITRDESIELYAGKDVEWVRELYATHKIIVIKLTGKYLIKLLGKLKNPQKHDPIDNAMHKLLDTYSRLYLAGQGKIRPTKKRKMRRRKMRNLIRGGRGNEAHE